MVPRSLGKCPGRSGTGWIARAQASSSPAHAIRLRCRAAHRAGRPPPAPGPARVSLFLFCQGAPRRAARPPPGARARARLHWRARACAHTHARAGLRPSRDKGGGAGVYFRISGGARPFPPACTEHTRVILRRVGGSRRAPGYLRSARQGGGPPPGARRRACLKAPQWDARTAGRWRLLGP